MLLVTKSVIRNCFVYNIIVKLGVSGFPVTVSALLSDFKHRCIKFTVAAVISLLLLLLLLVAGILLAYYCK